MLQFIFTIDEKTIRKGDRVFYNRKHGKSIGYGEIGTVLGDPDPLNNVPVCWDLADPRKYSLLGCENHHGWIVSAQAVKKIL